MTFLPCDRTESPGPGVRARGLLLWVSRVRGPWPACDGVGSLAAGPAAPQVPDRLEELMVVEYLDSPAVIGLVREAIHRKKSASV